MTDETRIGVLLRSALPPVVAATPSRDVWLDIVTRSEGDQTWSWLDVGLAAGVAIVLTLQPDLLMLLAYHF